MPEYNHLVSGKILDDMKRLVDATIEDSREHIFKICNNAKLVSSNECAGKVCKIREGHVSADGLKCPDNYDEMGTFHTHTGPSAYPSVGDILTTIISRHKLLCIGAKGYKNEKIIKCYEHPFKLDKNKIDEYIKAHENADDVYKEKTGRDLRKDISDKNVKIKHFKTEKDVKVFMNHLDRSFDKKQILERHYDDIYISDTFELRKW